MVIKDINNFRSSDFEDLVRSAVNRNLVLVIGAGVSRNVTKKDGTELPNWKELLKEIGSTLPNELSYKDLDKILLQGNYLEAADFLSHHCKSADIQKKICNTVYRDVSTSNIDSDWYKHITTLNPRIIITTNYDTILEDYFDVNSERDNFSLQYQVIHPENHASDLVRLLRQDRPVIIKMHGTCEKGEKVTGMVLSTKQYSRNISEHKKLYDILRSLLLTKTFLFLGYSVGDPDFTIMLQETKYYDGGNPVAHHYMISSRMDEYHKDVLKEAYDIQAIEYDGDHELGHKILGKIAEEVQNKSYCI